MMSANHTDQLAFDRDRVLSWWTGRITNAELATWSGQSERDVRLILNTPFMRGEVIGGGRGSKNRRRISRKARNAVAIVAALRKAGMSIETAASLLDGVPVLAGVPTEVIDFSPSVLESAPAGIGLPVSLALHFPDEGWLPTDIVPDHICFRHCRPIVKSSERVQFRIGDIGWLPDWQEALGGMPEGWRKLGEPIYRPEIDPLGSFEFGNQLPDANDQLDDHFYIVDGRWVFVRHHNPSPREYLLDLYQAFELGLPRRFEKETVTYSAEFLAEIDPANRVVQAVRGDEAKEREAERARLEPETMLDVNATLAVRRMKRSALGLTGGGDE